MPMFEFKCESCYLRFEKLVKNRDTTHYNCPECGSNSERQLSAFGFQFASGKTTGNTGVDSLDSSVDKSVGRDADRRWEMIKNRRAYKQQVQYDNGGIGKVPLAKDPITGEYVPVPATDLAKIQELHTEYKEAYEEHKSRRVESGVGKFVEDDPYQRYRNQRKLKASESENQ